MLLTPIFQGMMDKGLIRRDDPAMVAFAYTAPISVISDCVTSYDLKKMDEMLAYYTAKGCEVKTLEEYITDEGKS